MKSLFSRKFILSNDSYLFGTASQYHLVFTSQKPGMLTNFEPICKESCFSENNFASKSKVFLVKGFFQKVGFLYVYIINVRYAWLGKSWLKSFLSSVDSQKVFLRSALCPQITMVSTQLIICLLFVPRNPQIGSSKFHHHQPTQSG